MKLFQTGGCLPETNYILWLHTRKLLRWSSQDLQPNHKHKLLSPVFPPITQPGGAYLAMTNYYPQYYYFRYPANITLLCGNHESRQLTQVYGFYDECQRKHGNANAWWYCADVFDYLTLFSNYRWNCNVFCVHGGLSLDIQTIDQMRVVDRNCEIPHEGPFCDLMWSDPEDIELWAVSPRRAGWLFGSRVTSEFELINARDLVCRAHQLVQESLKYMFQDKGLVTVWSAPN